MQRKKKATKEAKEEVDEFAEALKRAAGTQVSDLLPATMSHEDKVRALTDALRQHNAIMHDQSVAASRQLGDAKEQIAAMVRNGRMTEEEATNALAYHQQWLGITEEQDRAIREGLSLALKQEQANLLVEQSVERINVQRAKSTDELMKEFETIQAMRALQLTFNDAIRESRDAYLQQAAAIALSNIALHEKIKLEIISRTESPSGDDSDLERGIKQEQRIQQIRIDQLRLAGNEEQAITLETERAKREARLQLLNMGITDQATIDQELANIEQVGLNRLLDNDLAVADARAESMRIYSDAVAQGLGAIFGENKAIQSAQVVIDTYAGAQKAFAALAPNLPLQIAASGAVVAQGIAALRKINSTKKGTRSVSRTGGGASSSPQPRSFVNDLGAAGQVAGTITPFGSSMRPNISITANLDRQGLALAVRDGESDIATRQIPFAS
jgi:hypothetical protein